VEFARRRVAIFEPHEDLETNPTLICLLDRLRAEGAEVDVFMPESRYYPPVGRDVKPYPLAERRTVWHGGIRSSLKGWLACFNQLRADRIFGAKGYDLIVGIDCAGVITGYHYASRFDISLVYLSFEIFFHDEQFSREEVKEKQEECVVSRHADLVIIQDEWRAELLARENGIPPEKFEYLPVSAEGSITKSSNQYLRQHLGISEKRSIVLHSGSFAEWTYADELLDSVRSWPEEFILVIHTRYTLGETDKYFKRIGENGSGKIILSDQPLPFDEYEELVASADIGLVLYKPGSRTRYEQKNIENIGLASGKFSFYMKYGIPVISVNQKFYTTLLKDYAFGEVINTFEEMPVALDRIKANYVHHQAEARRLFLDKEMQRIVACKDWLSTNSSA
jgi:hypothetical protein